MSTIHYFFMSGLMHRLMDNRHWESGRVPQHCSRPGAPGSQWRLLKIHRAIRRRHRHGHSIQQSYDPAMQTDLHTTAIQRLASCIYIVQTPVNYPCPDYTPLIQNNITMKLNGSDANLGNLWIFPSIARHDRRPCSKPNLFAKARRKYAHRNHVQNTPRMKPGGPSSWFPRIASSLPPSGRHHDQTWTTCRST